MLIHTLLLYLGPIIQGSIEIWHTASQQQRNRQQQSSSSSSVFTTLRIGVVAFCKTTYKTVFHPVVIGVIHGGPTRWIYLRNLIIAPFTEEFVFRACLVPILQSTTLSNTQVCWITPLFFGVAHFHHAIQKLRQGEHYLNVVIIQTIFQFSYTTLFGAYVCYVYIRTNKSLMAITLSHSFCNWMGIPNFAFLSPIRSTKTLYEHRYFLMVVHLLGLFGFGVEFYYKVLLP